MAFKHIISFNLENKTVGVENYPSDKETEMEKFEKIIFDHMELSEARKTQCFSRK